METPDILFFLREEHRPEPTATQRRFQEIMADDTLIHLYLDQAYELLVKLLVSQHQLASTPWNWQSILSASPPEKPSVSHADELLARQAIKEFEPNWLSKVTGRAKSQRKQLAEAAIEARANDKRAYEAVVKLYKWQYKEWLASRQLAERILAGEAQAYADALNQTAPFVDIENLGSSVHIEMDPENLAFIQADLHVNDEKVIPKEETKRLKSGKFSSTPLSKTRFFELYQDYICSCVFRIARELFALLPIQAVITTAVAHIVSTQTGHLEEQPILSVAMPRSAVDGLNFDRIDPSDALKNFVHKMDFKRTEGFQPVQRILPSDLDLT